jgi:hypothetical protein
MLDNTVKIYFDYSIQTMRSLQLSVVFTLEWIEINGVYDK